MTTKTILLIHSEPNVREILQAYLTCSGHWQILCANSLSEGLRDAVQHQPDAIVLDPFLNGQDCFTFLHALRAEPITQTIPVVILTVGAKWLDSKRLQQLQVVGVIDYVSDATLLSSRISNLLSWDEPLPIKLES